MKDATPHCLRSQVASPPTTGPDPSVRHSTLATDGWTLALHHYPIPDGAPTRVRPLLLCHGLGTNHHSLDLDEARASPATSPRKASTSGPSTSAATATAAALHAAHDRLRLRRHASRGRTPRGPRRDREPRQRTGGDLSRLDAVPPRHIVYNRANLTARERRLLGSNALENLPRAEMKQFRTWMKTDTFISADGTTDYAQINLLVS